MTAKKVTGAGTKQSPWKLTTPSGSSEYEMYKDEAASPPALICVVGKTELRYQLRAIEDLHKMLKANGDWVPLGSADEQKPAAEGTVEAWGRSEKNPVGAAKSAAGSWAIGDGKPGAVSMRLRQALVDIQRGAAPDVHRWMHAVPAARL